MNLPTLVALCLALAVAEPAAAQAGAPAVPELPLRSLLESTADHAEASRLMSESGHSELFENVTQLRGPAVLHRASGMVCRYLPGSSLNLLHVYDAAPETEDVSCQTGMHGATVSHYASRLTPMPDAADLVHGALAAIRQRWGEVEPYDAPHVSLTAEGVELPQRHLSRMLLEIGGREFMSRVVVANLGDWSIKQRATVALERAAEGALAAEYLLLLALIDVRGAQAPATP